MKTKLSSLCLLVATGSVLVGCSSGQYFAAQAQPVPPPVENIQPEPAAMPPNILPGSPLAEVVKLVQSGVDENIVATYINNSGGTFNLDADKIIYLDNVGVPKNLVTAMMQRDQTLQAQMAAASTPPPSPPPAPETVATDLAPPPEPEVVTVDYFQATLQPYGNWVDIEGYGRCWRPTVAVYNPGWQPYGDRGHWVDSDTGWYWVSDYSWGATFHYGRWFHHARLGWCWWPDTVWAPSWVTWRYADNYCGWAPLPPFTVWQPGVGFAYRGSGISVGFDFGLAADSFIFVPAGHFCDPHPNRFRYAPDEVTRIYHQTTVINNYNFDSHNRTFINHGIEAQHIAAATHTTIRPVATRELRASAGQPGRGGLVGQPNRRPGTAVENPARTGSGFNNGNNSTPRAGTPEQNNFSHPANNQNPSPGRNLPAPVPDQNGNNLTPRSGKAEQNNFSRPVSSPNPQPGRNLPAPVPGQGGNHLTTHAGSPEQNNVPQPVNNPNQPAHNFSTPTPNQNGGVTAPNRYAMPASTQNPPANRTATETFAHPTAPANSQVQPVTRSSASGIQAPTPSFDESKRITSPRGQQFDQPMTRPVPQPVPQPAPARTFAEPAPQRQVISPPANAAAERFQPQPEPRPAYTAPPAHVSQPAPTAPAPAAQSSGKSGKLDQNGNSQGH